MKHKRPTIYYTFRKQGLKRISNISLMKDLGTRKMFTNQAGSPLKVSDAIQKSFIQVDERGTEVLLNHENRVLDQKYFEADHSLLCEILRREFCSSKGGFCQILEPTWFRRKERSKTAGPRKCWRVRFVRVCCVQSQLDSNDPNRLPSKDSYNRLSTEFL